MIKNKKEFIKQIIDIAKEKNCSSVSINEDNQIRFWFWIPEEQTIEGSEEVNELLRNIRLEKAKIKSLRKTCFSCKHFTVPSLYYPCNKCCKSNKENIICKWEPCL